MSRTILTNNLTVYVSPSGNDNTGDGSQGNPWATIQYARNYVQQNYDLNFQYTVTYQVQSGTYTAGCNANGPLIGQSNPLQETFNFAFGAAIVPTTSITIFEALYGAMISLIFPSNFGVTFEAPGSTGIVFCAGYGGIISVGPNVTLSNVGQYHIQTVWGGNVYWSGGYICGTSKCFVYASGGVVQLNPGSQDVFVNAVFTDAFVHSYNGVIGVSGQTFVNNCAGKTLISEMNGIIAGWGSCNYGPGTITGTCITGGQNTV